jgi:hypothetical protein
MTPVTEVGAGRTSLKGNELGGSEAENCNALTMADVCEGKFHERNGRAYRFFIAMEVTDVQSPS